MKLLNMTLLTLNLFNHTLNNNLINNDRPHPITIKPIYFYNQTSIHIPLEENLRKPYLRKN